MEIIILPTPAEVGRVAAAKIASVVAKKPSAVIGLATGSSPQGIYTGCEPTPVFHYGHGYGVAVGQGKVEAGLATNLYDDGYGWTGAGAPGDSGSGFLDGDGRAFGTLSTVAVAPLAGSNGLGDLKRELRYAREHSGIAGLRLVRGTEPFSPVL